jgi:hypothetical protein
VYAPMEDKTDDIKDSLYEKLEHVFNQFPKYHMNILIRDNAKVGREVIFNKQLGMRLYKRLIMMMEFEQ